MKLLTLILSLSCFASHAYVYESQVPAAAKTPLPGVDGRINYQAFSGGAGRRIANCVLVHGYGVNQKTIDMVNKVDNMKSRVPAMGDLVGILGSGFGNNLANALGGVGIPANALNATDALARSLARLAQMDATQAFGSFYFGEYLIGELLKSSCENVVIVLQESNQSTALEMIARTERFLRDVACGGQVAPGQIGCALVGHDKGAVVVTSIVRRCAEAVPVRAGSPLFVGGSELGQAGCSSIGEVYSSAGAIEGALLPVVIAGSRNLDERKKEFEKVQKWTLGLIDINKQFEDGMRKLQGLEEAGRKFDIDFFGDKTPDTNPFWYDSSPISEIDGFGEADRKVGVPIALRHGPGVTLARAGWLGNIEYAAASTAYRFDQAKYVFVDKNGLKRPRLDPNVPKPLTIYLPAIAERPKFLPEGGARLRNQSPEKVAKREKARRDLDFFWEPFINGQKIADGILNEMVGESHGDDQVPQTLKWGLDDIAKFAKENGMTDGKGKTTYLNRFKLAPGKKPEDAIFFQESDGLVEKGTALGLCERSMKVDPKNLIVASCATFAATNHLGLSGMSIDSANHIVKQLSAKQLAPLP